jgi:hypothetical protein
VEIVGLRNSWKMMACDECPYTMYGTENLNVIMVVVYQNPDVNGHTFWFWENSAEVVA